MAIPNPLEELLESQCCKDDPGWIALHGAWLQATGLIRRFHLRRSTLVSLNLHFVVFWCYMGKRRQRRSGFFWVAPRCLTDKFDIGVQFANAYLDFISHRQALELPSPRFLIFDVEEKCELAGSAIQASLQQALGTKLDNPEQLDANSWRRLGPTWAHRCGLTRDDENAIGDWVAG